MQIVREGDPDSFVSTRLDDLKFHLEKIRNWCYALGTRVYGHKASLINLGEENNNGGKAIFSSFLTESFGSKTENIVRLLTCTTLLKVSIELLSIISLWISKP